jgi:AraC-like DNA-binding protein
VPQDIVSHIDCFSFIFPKDDPRSADAYTRTMRPVFDFEIPKSARKTRFSFRRITDPAESGLRFSQLAFDLGFSHASAFTRAFGEFFGISPKDAKALAVQPEEHELEFLLSPEGRPYIHPVRSPAAPVGRA